ncbi:hypothetical protein BC826DRAFT_985809 [Russula brevipes]|nr:hypothetical protein BC826DRAFT_985809 [Russula brevipes]
MSDEHLPGYNIDDDPHDEPSSTSQSPAVNLEHPADPVSVASAGDPSPAAASTSPSSPILTQPTPAPPSQQEEEEGDPTSPTLTPLQRPAVDEFADPKIAELHLIFPDYDAAILHSVVDSVGGDQDRAVDALLAMSDPDHVPTHNVAAPEQPSVVEQTQLDEEFARQLMLEDEQQYAREQIARRQQQQQEQQQFPYAQRTNAPIPHQQQQGDRGYGTGTYDSDDDGQHSPQRDTMTDMQEQFSKLAESGKRTFSTFVSKVKAKVQEFDQTRNVQNPSSSAGSTSTGTGYIAQPSSPGLDRHAQQAYYAPRAVSNPRPPVSPEVENPQQQQPSSLSSTVPTDLPSASAAAVDDDSAGILPPPVTNSGRPASNIDPGKIGLLPKRPVSLVNTEAQPSHAQDEEEELEYVENPFEEGKYS